MSEIITLAFGKAGVKISESFLNKIAEQHNIGSEQQRGMTNVFFHDSQKNNQPRSIYIAQSQTLDNISANKGKSPLALQQQNLIHIKQQSSGTYAQSMYHCQDQVSSFMQQVRRQAQSCDKLSGFILIDSFAGGIGSGMSSSVLFKLMDWHDIKGIIQQYSIMPESSLVCSPLHTYNTILSTHPKIECSTINMPMENKACYQRLKKCEMDLHPSNDRVNGVLAQNICQVTAPFRFGGTLNTNPRKLCQNMIMFPRLKFMCSSHSSKIIQKGETYLQSALSSKNFMIQDFYAGNRQGNDVFLSHIHCRDNFTYEQQIYQSAQKYKLRQNLVSTEWIPCNIHASISNPINGQKKASVLVNSKHIINHFKQWTDDFTTLFRRKAFLQSYIQRYGMDEMQFTQSESNVNDLISQYIPHYNQYDSDDENQWENYQMDVQEEQQQM